VPSASSQSFLTSPPPNCHSTFQHQCHCTVYSIQQFLMHHDYFWLDVLLCHYEAHWLNNTSSNLVNKDNFGHNLILVCSSISTCFRWLCTHHQEKQLCLCDTWSLLLCVDDCLVYRVEWNIYISWFINLPEPICSGLLYCVCSDTYEFLTLFTVFNLWIGPGFIFESCS